MDRKPAFAPVFRANDGVEANMSQTNPIHSSHVEANMSQTNPIHSSHVEANMSQTNPIHSSHVEADDGGLEFWLFLGGGILGFILLTIFAVMLVVFCLRLKKKKYKTSKESLFIRKPVKIVRYSSSENGESPPLSLGSPKREDFRGSFSSLRVQPKLGSSQSLHSIHNQHNHLSVAQTDSYGTSDEEDAQAISTSGRIWFSLKYDSGSLNVHLIKVRYLRGRGMSHELRDPFVRLYILPDEVNYQQSKVRKRTLSPKFNESFTFMIDPPELPNRTLKLSVYDIDKRNVRHSLGHALVPLGKIDEISTQSVIWKNLESVSQKLCHLGEILFTLLCNPYTERVKLTINRIRELNFKCIDKDQYEIFVKTELFYGRKLMKVKETSKHKLSETVEIYQNFSFCIVGKYFDSCSLVLTVILLKSSSKIEEMYGRVTVGPFMYARGEELLHWQDMIANPRTAIERWHHITEVTQ